MNTRWPFRSKAELAEDSDLGDERKEAPRPRAWIFPLAGLLVLTALTVWWRGPSAPTLRPGPGSDPLPAVRSLPRPTPAPPESKTAEAHSGPQQQLAALGWQLAVKERETRLIGLETHNRELEARSKEAQAKIEEADARIKALKRNPDLAIRSLFAVPPPPSGFPQGSGPMVVPPKQVETTPGPPERTPKESEIFVRMIDASGRAPEAVVSVGPASYVVRSGDAIGSWQVAGIGPNGIWIKAGLELAWRPLLARGTKDHARGSPQ